MYYNCIIFILTVGTFLYICVSCYILHDDPLGFFLLDEIPAGANSVLKILLKERKSKMVFDVSFSYNNYVKLQAHLYREKWDGTKILGASCTVYTNNIRCFLALNMCYILPGDLYAICLFYSRCIIPFLMYNFTLFLNTMCKDGLYWQYFVIMMWLLFTDMLIMFIIPYRIVRISMVNCFNLCHKIWQHCLRRLINCKRSALKLLWHPLSKTLGAMWNSMYIL